MNVQLYTCTYFLGYFIWFDAEMCVDASNVFLYHGLQFAKVCQNGQPTGHHTKTQCCHPTKFLLVPTYSAFLYISSDVLLRRSQNVNQLLSNVITDS